MNYSFKILTGVNILDLMDTFDAVCITTNAVVNKSGNLIMGAGVAKQFSDRYPDIKVTLGSKVSLYGNNVYQAKVIENMYHRCYIMSFPTKNHYRDSSSLELIVMSAKRLVLWANTHNVKNIAIPSPGTGLGGLDPQIVYSELDRILDDRFTITVL